jgi:hypothetical protein
MVNTIRYIFENKQPEVARLVVKYGLPPAKSKGDLWRKLNYVIVKFKEEVMSDLAELHPDKELIIWNYENSKKSNNSLDKAIEEKIESVSELKSNACGCSGADGSFSNCNGNMECTCNCEKKSNVEGNTKDKTPMIIIGSLLLVGGLLLLSRN